MHGLWLLTDTARNTAELSTMNNLHSNALLVECEWIDIQVMANIRANETQQPTKCSLIRQWRQDTYVI